MSEIQKLVSLLRENGDCILRGESILVLTVPVLQKLNDSFVLIDDRQQISKGDSFQARADRISEQQFHLDLVFLHDFFQKSPSLRLIGVNYTNSHCEAQSGSAAVISLEHFHSLQHLALHKVSPSCVRGLSAHSKQLRSLVCEADPSLLLQGPSSWSQLRAASFPRAGLSTLPTSLTTVAPSLAILDLGHNQIAGTDGSASLSELRTLRRLSLAYNLLERVPAPLPPGLHALGLSCNYIDDIQGVSGLELLTELDLSGNCLSEHGALWPLETLPSLRRVDLRDNPLAYHPHHRTLTANHLHPDSLTAKFVLDGRPLSRLECQSGLSQRKGRSKRATIVAEERPTAILVPSQEDSVSNRSSTASEKTLIVDDIITEGRSSTTVVTPVGSSNKSSSGKKSRPIREAVIADSTTQEDADGDTSTSLTQSFTSLRNSPPETSAEHLETKRRVESLRQMFGREDWLHSQGGSCLQDVLGLPPTTLTVSALLGGHAENITAPVVSRGSVPQPTDGGHDGVEVLHKESAKHMDESQAESTSESTAAKTNDTKEEDEEEEEEDEEPIPVVDEDDEDDDESEQQIYAVRRVHHGLDKVLDIFLVVTDRQLKERDIASARQLCRWEVETLQSCEVVSVAPPSVVLTFDTVRPDRRERTYVLDDVQDSQRLVKTLRAILDARPLHANKLSVFRCMKCSSQFSDEITSPLVPDPRVGGQLRCPNCGSAVVIQTEEDRSPVPRVRAPSPRNGRQSPSQSSIGSAASLDASAEAPSGASATNGATRRYDSDIEIISNPSQSSIEVLDSTGARTPGRKRSSEERMTVVPPPAVPPYLSTVPPPLTESSSSGSLTDSVCTTYEGATTRTAAPPDVVACTGLTAETGTKGIQTTQPNGKQRLVVSTPSGLQYNYDDFSQVDHRIKLHLYVNVFREKEEELTALVKGSILYKSMAQPKPALLVLSTHKIYLLSITKPEGEEPERWLSLLDSWPTRLLQTVCALPWDQGISLSLSTAPLTSLLLLLFDGQRTVSLLNHLSRLELSKWCQLRTESSKETSEMVRQMTVTPSDPEPSVRAAAFFTSASIVSDTVSGVTELGPGTVVVSDSTLFVTVDSLTWLLPPYGKKPVVAASQSISNLVEVEVKKEELTPVFLDETSGIAREVRWTLTLGTEMSVAKLLDAVRPPWEQLFSLPLQVSISGQPD